MGTSKRDGDGMDAPAATVRSDKHGQDRCADIKLERLLSVAHAAEFMGVRPATVYAWVEAGRLPCLRAGSLIRFERESLFEWLKGREGRD